MSDDRHLANLADMKTAFDAKMQEWTNEDVARDQMRAEWRASFEAGLAHFAEVTGLHDEVAPLVREVRGEPVAAEPASSELPEQSPASDDIEDSGAAKIGGGAIRF